LCIPAYQKGGSTLCICALVLNEIRKTNAIVFWVNFLLKRDRNLIDAIIKYV
jgi:hypothetical protein